MRLLLCGRSADVHTAIGKVAADVSCRLVVGRDEFWNLGHLSGTSEQSKGAERRQQKCHRNNCEARVDLEVCTQDNSISKTVRSKNGTQVLVLHAIHVSL